MFSSEHHNVVTSSKSEKGKRRWALLTVFALLAGYLLAVMTPPPPAQAEFAFSCSSSEGIAYFVNANAGSVSLVYTGTDQNFRNIPVGGTPYGLASLPDGSKVYVANGNGTVQMINTATLAVTTINHPSFSTPVGAWSSADGSKVFISNIGSTTVSVIDTATNTVSRVITVGTGTPRPGWMDAYGDELFVAMENAATGGIAVLDMNSTSTTTSRVIAGAAPAHTVAVNDLFIASANQTTAVTVRNRTAPSAVVRTITTAESIHGMTFVPDTNYLVLSSTAGHVYVYDASTGALLRTFTGGASNMRIPVASPIGNEVYIAGGTSTTGTMDRLVTVGPPASWTYTPNQTALQAYPDGHDPAFSCLPPLKGSKAFAKSPIAMGETTALTFTITNPNIAPPAGVSGVTLTDNLPSNIRVAPTGTATTTCGSGVVSAPPGGETVSMTGGVSPAAAGPDGSIVPGTCTITVPVIGVAPGSQTNTVEPSGLSADVVGPALDGFSAPIEVLAPGLAITKSNDDADGVVNGGQVLTYSLTVTNSGTIPQTGITVDDTLPAGVTYLPESTFATQGTTTRDNIPGGANPDLAGGDPTAGALVSPTDTLTIPAGGTMTVTYRVTVDTPAPANVDTYTNTASVSSTQEPTPITATDTVEAPSALELVKAAGAPDDVNGNGITDAGDTIAYTFTVTNTGNTTVSDIAVTDPMVADITCDVTTIEPDGAATCTAAPHVITQAETDAGQVDNTASAGGTDPSGDPVTSNDSSTSTPTDQAPELTFDKSAGTPVDVNANGITDAGDTIAYTFTVTNTGNVTISDIEVDDDLVGTVTCDATTLAPGDVANCTAAPYTITDDDQALGEVENTASATGNDPGGDPVPSDPDTTNTPVVPSAPSLTIDKSAGDPVDVNGNGITDIGDTIAYTFVVTNTGNVPLDDITVNDPKAGTVTCDVTTLLPDEVANCTAAPYAVTQEDVDNGSVDNSATATGTPPGEPAIPSEPDTTNTPTDQTPALTFDKTAGEPVDVNANGITDAGDTIAYTFTVTNTGNVTITDVIVTDDLVGTVTCDITTLAPGGVANCTAAPYTITDDDETAGEVENTATATGNDPGGDPVPSDPDTTNTPVEAPAPELTFDKTAGTPVDVNANGIADSGDTIAYTFTVTNTGNVTVTDIAVDDDLVGAVTCDETTLAPGDVANCTAAPYTITDDDETAGAVENTASATGNDPDGDPVPSDPDTTNTPVEPSVPSLTIDKTAGDPVDVNGNGITDVGDTIAYTFVVTNTGNVPLDDITVDDPKAGTVTCDVTTLVPDETANCTAQPYAITQADVDNGSVDNTTTATGTPPGEPAVPSEPDTTNTPTDQTPELTFDKTAGEPVDVNANGITDAGDTIAYTFTVTNTGNVTITDVIVTDDLVGTVTCDITTLAPGGVANCTAAPYTITDDDEAAGEVENTASATGTDTGGDPVPSDPDSTNTPVIPSAPSLTIDKSAGDPVDVNGNGITDVGDTIDYTFVVTNTGNVPLDEITVDDPKAGAVTCDVTTLAPGAVANCTAAPYAVTQEDLDNGSVDNSATATGTPPGEPAIPSEPDTTNTPTDQSPELTFDKTAGDPVDVNANGITDSGDTIAYTFTVTNTGNVTISDIIVDDPKVGTVTCDVTALAPGDVANCTAEPYTITDDDEAAGEVENTASATGNDPGGDPVPSDPDTTNTPVEPSAPSLTIDKTAGTPVDVNANGITDIGDTIEYTFVVTNTGNVPLDNITVDDPKAGAVTCDVTTLLPDEVANCTAQPYVITQADVDNGSVDNSATATGTPPGEPPVPSEPDTTNTPAEPSAPSLTIDKTAGEPVDVNANGITDIGDTIAYTFVVTNTGNVPLDDITVDDPKAGTVTCDVTTLAPGAVANCTAAPYVVTQEDVDNGSVDNTATATGTPPGEPTVPSDPDTTNTPAEPSEPSLTIDKSADDPVDVNGNGLTDVGDTIAYTFVVTNTGNVPLNDITVDDPKVGTVTCDATTLAPGEFANCTAAPYVITQADVDSGEVENTATATGTPPGEPPVPSEPDTHITPADQVPAIVLDKIAGDPVDVNENGITDAGDTIDYTFTVTNTGTVTIADITVDDARVGAVTCDVTTLAPGEVANCTAATYTITEDDEAAGAVENTATANGTDPGGDPVPSDPDTTNTPAEPSLPSLTIDKSGSDPVDVNGNGLTDFGDTIAYTFTVTNTGNVPLDAITVDDPKAGAVTCDVTTLAPGAVANCTAAPYVITLADIDNGEVENTATATGTPPGEPEVPSEPDTYITPIDQEPSLLLDKTAGTPVDVNANGIADAGDTIDFTFTVTNTGNVTITDVTVNDPKVGIVTCDITTLAPGAVANCTAVPYVITEDDEAAGAVTNTAGAAGIDPDGDTVPSNDDSTNTPVVPSAPSLTIDKIAGDPVDVNGNDLTDVGDTIDYTFVVTNTGNVPLNDITVDDPKAGAVTCDVTTLAPGAVANCTAEPYAVTQADLDNGSVDNSATATGTPPGEPAVPSVPDTTNTPTDQAPAMELVKTNVLDDTNRDRDADSGEVIHYAFEITNTGNVTVENVGVDDPLLASWGDVVTCDLMPLAPGESMTCAASHTVTRGEVTGAAISNTATATGTIGDNPITSNPSTTTTPTDASAPAPVPPKLPNTGGEDQRSLALMALALVMAGAALMIRKGVRRRTTRTQ